MAEKQDHDHIVSIHKLKLWELILMKLLLK